VTYTGNLGFTFATLFMFMFICELASQTSAFLRKDAEGGLEVRLRWLERIFSVLPFTVVAMTWLFVFDPAAQSRLRLLVFQSIILVAVLSAFSFVIHALNKKVLRLLPRRNENPEVVVKSSNSVMVRIWASMPCSSRANGQIRNLDITSEQLLASSKRLRRMAQSLRTYLLLYAVFGGVYVVLENLEDTPPRIARIPHYFAWQFILSSIPTAGIDGLTIMTRVVPFRSRIIGNGTTNPVTGSVKRGKKSVTPESSCVGTLTS
jgi:hypothetical protein